MVTIFITLHGGVYEIEDPKLDTQDGSPYNKDPSMVPLISETPQI